VDRLTLPCIVAEIPAAELSMTRDLAYATRGQRPLHADVVAPIVSRGTIVLLHGEPALEEGGRFWSEDRAVKDSGPIQSWARLLAANGFTAVAPNLRSSDGFRRPDEVDADVDALIAAVARHGAPTDRIGVLAFSGGTPFALALARRDRRVRAIVTMYGALDLGDRMLGEWFPGARHPVTQRWDPMMNEDAPAAHLHVWPERDWLPNGAATYASHAGRHGFAFSLERHENGVHGFDFLNDDDRSRAIIARILAFLRDSL
jgi:dienelactone hydrolase